MTIKVHEFIMHIDLRVNFLASPGDVTIDSNVQYNEGDKMTFNCSVKGDPNYSTAYLELIKNSQILYTIPGPMFGSDYISNCSAVLNWSGGFPNPLTTLEHDLIVRCVVQNKLLNETRNSEKKLNVSAAGMKFISLNSLLKNFVTIYIIHIFFLQIINEYLKYLLTFHTN